MAPSPPVPLWVPAPARRERSRIGQWLTSLAFDSYDDAWAWSVERPEEFWPAAGRALGVEWGTAPDATVIAGAAGGAAGAQWFPGGTLNYARQALRGTGRTGDQPAVVARSQTRPPTVLTWDQLRTSVGAVRRGLRDAGVGPGDRVAGFLPNIPEALIALLATAAIGAVWTSCAPETGVTGALDRLAQVEPSVLIGVDGYRYGDRAVDRREELRTIRAGLPSVHTAVWVPYLDAGPPPAGWVGWETLASPGGPALGAILDVPADHPLCILYSSGTTGRPKAIVHGHGGITVEHAKALAFHFDVGPADRLFWYTTTGWMMWNFLVSGLLVGATVVLFDGDPSWPDPGALWALMEETATTVAGVGAASLVAAHKAGLTPRRDHGLAALRTLGSTGSPLPAATAAWVYRAVADPDAPDLMLASFSGGTDVCTGFVGTTALHPVWAGEISCRCLGARVEVFDDEGRSVVGREGELVLTAPLPSMPVGFWDDPDRRRYLEAYFDRFPGVWAHGDRMTLTDRGTCIITGRSDGTLNRGGVRMGTAEFYAVVEAFDEVADSLVVHVPDGEGGNGALWLFVVPAEGASGGDGLGDGLADRLRAALRADLSPRHVPDRIVTVAAVPRTLSGKKLEVPVKRILAGTPVADALTVASVANPESLDAIVAARASS